MNANPALFLDFPNNDSFKHHK